MSDRSEAILAVTPRLHKRETGGWFAVSPPGAPLRIGVQASTRDEVRIRFKEALEEWAKLADAREPVGGKREQ